MSAGWLHEVQWVLCTCSFLKHGHDWRVCLPLWGYVWCHNCPSHLKWHNFQKQKSWSSTLDACFWTTYKFSSFHAKAPWNSSFFCCFPERYSKWIMLWKLGLDILLNSVLVTFFVSHFLSCCNNLKMDGSTTMAPKIGSFYLVFL